jgi:glycosyltransferase involved in cell wall biosynthesis
MTRTANHTFAIPVYLGAPNLVTLIASLRAQIGAHSEILLATSTPSAALDTFAERYALPLHINPQRSGIAADWNFALAAAQTDLVTLAHQDDYFGPSYVARLSGALLGHSDAMFAFCDYSEHTTLGARPENINLRIKRALCRRAFGASNCITESRDKVRLLSLGNPICCPSVMLNRAAIPDFSFPIGFQSNLDWMAWLELARRPGGFVYVREKLVSKGIHAETETTASIANCTRQHEDRAAFDALWPRPVAAALAAIYRFGYRANRA